MTETEWLACEDGGRLLKRARIEPGGRKIRLLLCAWCKRRWDVLDERYQRAVEVAEQYADGLATAIELDEVRSTARTARKMYGVPLAYARTIQFKDVVLAAGHLAYYPYDSNDPDKALFRAAEKQAQLRVLRDIFPFRPITLDPSWLTSTVTALARQMYDSRDFSAMPILADALQDAGCDHADVLQHCRGPGPHCRGCFVVDLLLKKE